MSRLFTNDDVLTDELTDREMVDQLIQQLYKAGEIFSPSDMTTGVHVTPDVVWELTPKSLLTLVGGNSWASLMNPVFLNGVPWDARDEDGDEDEAAYFETLTTNQIAEMVGESSIEYGSIQNEMGEHRDGYERTALIVVHKDTTQLGGFIPLVRAYRKKHEEFPMLPPVKVFVHNGTKASLRPFEETPLSIRQSA